MPQNSQAAAFQKVGKKLNMIDIFVKVKFKFLFCDLSFYRIMLKEKKELKRKKNRKKR